MPVHDWTQVRAGVFHDFHTSWITHIKEELNAGLLPDDHYAQSEQRVADRVADVLTLRGPSDAGDWNNASELEPGELAVATAPPRVAGHLAARKMPAPRPRQRRLLIRHVSGHRVVAVLEIVSPANKDRLAHVVDFVGKAADLLVAEIHLLVIDLFPPGPHDPAGIHSAIWEELEEHSPPPPVKPLIAVAYDAGPPPVAYFEPLALSDPLPTMPLFLAPGRYINLPLGPSYDAAWQGTPRYWREVVLGQREPE